MRKRIFEVLLTTVLIMFFVIFNYSSEVNGSNKITTTPLSESITSDEVNIDDIGTKIISSEVEIQEELTEEEIRYIISQNYTMEYKSIPVNSKIKSIDYICYRPTVSKDEKLPMIVYLHGADGVGNNLDKIMKIKSIPSYIDKGYIYPNAIIITPQCPSGSNWQLLSSQVMELINYVVDDENVDINRISLTGCSLGGIGTFSIAIQNPDYFSCIVPVCASVRADMCDVLVNIPVKIFHGTRDTGMGFSVKYANQVINNNGGNSELIWLQGEGHEIRHVYYDEEYDLINWMISQKRNIE